MKSVWGERYFDENGLHWTISLSNGVYKIMLFVWRDAATLK